MRYEILTYRCGAVTEVVRHIPRKLRGESSGLKGPKPDRKTKEEIEAANARQAVRKLIRKINANFRPGDLHVTLTYDGKRGRPGPEEAKRIVRKFQHLVRKAYKAMGQPYKYVLVTEYKNKAIHHHLIANWVNDGTRTAKDIIRNCWTAAGGTGRPKYVDLDESGDYQKLAAYLIKETEKTFREEGGFRQRYSCSRNLIDPKPVRRTVKVKNMWDLSPRTRPGYHIEEDSVYNGFDKAGYPYQSYYLIKDRPAPEDWDPPGKVPRDTT